MRHLKPLPAAPRPTVFRLLATVAFWDVVFLALASAAGIGFVDPAIVRGQFGQGTVEPTSGESVGAPKIVTEAAAVAEFWKRHDVVRQRLLERKQPAPVLTSAEGSIGVLVDKAHVGVFYEETGPSRFLAWKLEIANRTSKPITITRKQMEAEIDGETFSTQDVPSRMGASSFISGDSHFLLMELQPPKELTIPPGALAQAWLVYGPLSMSSTVPPCRLKLTIGTETLTVSVNELQRALLNPSVERLGPQNCLALLTIGGPMNAFNVQSLVDELDLLAAQRVTRAVLRWAPESPPPDSQLAAWLLNSAIQAGTGRPVSEQLPALGANFRELHVVEPKQPVFHESDAISRAAMTSHVHDSASSAVAAALRTACLALPLAQLEQQLAQGHPLARAAALIHGASRFTQEDLPRLQSFTADAEPEIRQAALRALGDFGDIAARETLVAAARGSDATLSRASVVTLASSRFASHREVLPELLRTADAELQERIITALANPPRPIWADLLAEHAVTSRGAIRMDVLRALVTLNHHAVSDLLERGLKSEDETVREAAFSLLIARSDERSYRLALAYATESLDRQPPNGVMQQFLNRSKDPRVIPPLLRHLRTSSDKASLISLLGQLGASQANEPLRAMFPKLQPHEQVAAINTLRLLCASEFLEVAELGLLSKDPSVIQHSVQTLLQEGSPRAQQLLYEAMEAPRGEKQVLMLLAGAMASLGTTESRAALKQASQSSQRERREAGFFGLQLLRQNSPALQTVRWGEAHLQQRQIAEAAELFRVATELDPDLPEARVGLGMAKIQQKKYEDAAAAFRRAAEMDPTLIQAQTGLGDANLKLEKWADAAGCFEKALELNDRSGMALSGLGISRVMMGRLADGLKLVEDARPRFRGDVNYFYNAACVFGRAIEQTRKQPPSEDRDDQIERYRSQAIADLQEAVRLGFDDIKWMAEDPDLRSMHDFPEFQQLVQGGPKGS